MKAHTLCHHLCSNPVLIGFWGRETRMRVMRFFLLITSSYLANPFAYSSGLPQKADLKITQPRSFLLNVITFSRWRELLCKAGWKQMPWLLKVFICPFSTKILQSSLKRNWINQWLPVPKGLNLCRCIGNNQQPILEKTLFRSQRGLCFPC